MRRFPRPSPAMAVALAALIVTLTGTAIAGGVFGKKSVNKIISKRAPGLSVKSADTANTAGNVSNQLWAVVNANGTLARHTAGITGASNDGTAGRNIVTTNRNLSNCFYTASIGGTDPNVGTRAYISVNPLIGDPSSVYVHTGSASAANDPFPFTLLIRC